MGSTDTASAPTVVPEPLVPAMSALLLAVADDKLLLGHRNSDWTGLGPILEEDIAFSSLAQDEIAHAQALYEITGGLTGRTGDALAFGRDPASYRSAAIVEVPDEFDWAVAIARQLFCDHFDLLRLQRLAASSWTELAALAARLVAEERVHVEHVASWARRLGAGTDESAARMQTALDRLAPMAPALFEPVDGQADLRHAGLYPGDDAEMYDAWKRGLCALADEARLDLELPAFDPDPPAGGRRGVHTEFLVPLLDEMCAVYRIEPDAAW
jgi:ring-1,2-phenylacetyl-CoA epoxidase subunit PaaC